VAADLDHDSPPETPQRLSDPCRVRRRLLRTPIVRHACASPA
jgi:hypothetical protein